MNLRRSWYKSLKDHFSGEDDGDFSADESDWEAEVADEASDAEKVSSLFFFLNCFSFAFNLIILMDLFPSCLKNCSKSSGHKKSSGCSKISKTTRTSVASRNEKGKVNAPILSE